jgi:uncharacterized lipoprotein YajG
MKKLLPVVAILLLAACCKKGKDSCKVKPVEAVQEQSVDLKDSKELAGK